MATNAAMFIKITGDTAGVQRAVSHLEQKLQHEGMSKFLSGVVYPWIRSRAAERFDSEGDAASGAWAPLRESTQAFRASQGFPEAHPINRRTGELERYITGSDAVIFPAPAGTFMKYPAKEAGDAMGLRQKVKTAQRGNKKPKTVPRPVMSIGIADMNFTLGSLALYIQQGGNP